MQASLFESYTVTPQSRPFTTTIKSRCWCYLEDSVELAMVFDLSVCL